MFWWPLKSTIVIALFITANGTLLIQALNNSRIAYWGEDSKAILNETASKMRGLEFTQIQDSRPVLSLFATEMESFGQKEVFLTNPNGDYYTADTQEKVTYKAERGELYREKGKLKLLRQAHIHFRETDYSADMIVYRHDKSQMTASGAVIVDAILPKSGQHLHLNADKMKANPKTRFAETWGAPVKGFLKEKQTFRPPLHFEGLKIDVLGQESQVKIFKEVFLKRGEVTITSQSGDIFLENKNKKLKYFVLNDDVKVTEILKDPSGTITTRKAFAERVEGFGEDRIVMTGAPRVINGKDVIKGYRITLREKLEVVEVDDAMSDISTKKDKPRKGNAD